MLLDTVKTYAIIGLGIACAGLALSTYAYRTMYNAADFALEQQNEAIEAQNEQAEAALKRLTDERDELQQSLNKAASTAKERQNAFDKELEGLRAAAAQSGPIRVRVQSCDAGRGGGGAISAIPSTAQDSAGAPATASGLLSDTAARRTERAMIEVEELSRDFNSCQDALLPRLAVERRRTADSNPAAAP